jgi:purine-binding chemotaxis protein CheW
MSFFQKSKNSSNFPNLDSSWKHRTAVCGIRGWKIVKRSIEVKGANMEGDGNSDKRNSKKFEKINLLEAELIELKRSLIEQAATIPDEVDDGSVTFLLISSAQRLFAIPINQVEEVLQMVATSPLSNKKDEVMGLVNYRGQMIAVLDFRQMVGQEAGTLRASSSLVICRLSSHTFALMVDETTDVLTIGKEAVRVEEEVLPGVLKAVGVVSIPDGVAIILDMRSLALSVQLDTLEGNIKTLDGGVSESGSRE